MRPVDPTEARAWDSIRAREYIAKIKNEFPLVGAALHHEMKVLERHAPGAMYGFVLELSVLTDVIVNR